MDILKYLLFITILSLTKSAAQAQSFIEKLNAYADNYAIANINISKVTSKGYAIDTLNNTLVITFGGGFSEQAFTELTVSSIYNNINQLVPDELKQYKLSIVTEEHPIEFLVPNSLRSNKHDETRILKQAYKGTPWVKNISKPYTASRGLENNHISLWQSHGRYWRFDKNDWHWQRPRLFCTTEDLLSQSFVVPYIIPMLENAGAIVFTPRERDYQQNEVVVDNDATFPDGIYTEKSKNADAEHIWRTLDQPAFANTKRLYNVCDTPFVSGSARIALTTDSRHNHTTASWTPNIPISGKYAVYVTYPSVEGAVPDAHYTLYHKGGITEFRVNQQMGGSTWVYLGTFEFDSGEHDYGRVTLSNSSSHKGIVCADAVRFGGGVGNVLPAFVNVTTHMEDTIEVKEYSYTPTSTLSGLPRWAEAAKYSAFWYGMPYKLHSNGFDNDEYKNDIRCRSQVVNELSGGSIYNRDTLGRNVPLELNVAFHTDAGYSNDHFIGSLGIYMTDYNEGLTASGMDRYVSRDLISSILTNLNTDLRKYDWKIRKLWNKDYGEARAPLSPAVILEMLSHQNFLDMQMAYDPQFKFDFCRSVYKSIVKFLAMVHSRPYVIQPLPVKNFDIKLDEVHSVAHLSWKPTTDTLEPTADADDYILYIRQGDQGFDNGQIIHGTEVNVNLKEGELYSFKIAAVNKGGESFPSETLSAYLAHNSKGKILVVNAFTRLEGPATVNTPDEQGFKLDIDPGVQYGDFTGFCGFQKAFDPRYAGSEAANGLGQSGSELEGKIIKGNTFDYAYVHGKGIQAFGQYSFCSTSENALQANHIDLSQYDMIDVIFGVQKTFDPATSQILHTYRNKGGRILISGANISEKKLTDLNIDTIHGCGTEFTIYRSMNSESYPVPAVSVIDGSEQILTQPAMAFPMLAYNNNECAGTAYDGKDFKSIILGFPIESIKEQEKINGLMKAFISFLTSK